VFCQDALTGIPLSDNLCAEKREKPTNTLGCSDRLCPQVIQTDK